MDTKQVRVKTRLKDFIVDTDYLHQTIENIKESTSNLFDKYDELDDLIDYYLEKHNGKVYNSSIDFIEELLSTFKEFEE